MLKILKRLGTDQQRWYYLLTQSILLKCFDLQGVKRMVIKIKETAYKIGTYEKVIELYKKYNVKLHHCPAHKSELRPNGTSVK